MKAISLWQPFASAYLREDLKPHETRHWPCPAKIIGQRIMVHAAARVPSSTLVGAAAEAAAVAEFGLDWRKTLPFGALLGSVVITGCREMGLMLGGGEPAHDRDRAFGIWRDGRFAWRGEHRESLETPIPWKGGQGWFNVPDDLVRS